MEIGETSAARSGDRRQRGAMLLAQWGLLGLLCLVMVWPFGLMLAGYLAKVVTPAALMARFIACFASAVS